MQLNLLKAEGYKRENVGGIFLIPCLLQLGDKNSNLRFSVNRFHVA